MNFICLILYYGKTENINPGEILLEEFLNPMGVTTYKLAKDTAIPQTRVSEIIKGRRRITADTALRFSKYFGTTPKFWLGLQDDFDLEEEQHSIFNELSKIQTVDYQVS
jgi:addiction module HigA family antidote